jgi:hypothetical protein
MALRTRFAVVGTTLACLAFLAGGSAASAAEKDVQTAGFFGSTRELTFKSCFRRSKEALNSENFVKTFVEDFGKASVAVGEIGRQTEAAIKCVAGAGNGRTFYAIDVSSTIPGNAGDLALELFEDLIPPDGRDRSAAATAGNDSEATTVNRY